MKRYFIILILFVLVLCLKAQTVANLTATGTDLKWYTTMSGGNALDPATPLVHGQQYWASQTINGCESTERFAVTANLVIMSSPSVATHVSAQTQIEWKWYTVSGASGYRWSAANNYNGASVLGNVLTQTETGLTSNTSYTRYIWAHNASGCVSGVTTLAQSTSACDETPWSGSLSGFGAVGNTFTFLVLGTTSGGSIWGCDIYTDDSNLAKAAIHDGWVANGATKHISVTILAG